VTTSSADRVERGARLVGAGILVSRVLGLVRGRLFSHYFGLGNESDAYTAASRIPNVLRNLLGEGAISASFIPVYSAALARGDERGARALANALLGVLIGVIAILTLIGITLAPVLTALLAPGFDDVAGKAELTTRLMRVLFPMTGLMVLSGWCLGIQNAHRRFFLSYASGAAWSIVQIALLLFAGPGESDLVHLVWLLSWATLGGAMLQIAVQLPQVVRLMNGIHPTFATGTEGLRQTLMNFVPVVGALGLFQISSFIDQAIASLLPTGSVTSLAAANNAYLLPLSLFGVATAAAALPQMARDHATGERESLTSGIVRAWDGVLFYTIPSAIAFYGIGDSIITVLNGSGKFDADAVALVSFILAAYSLGLVAYASSRLLTSLYQATGNYRRPLICSASAIAISTAISLAVALRYRDNLLAVAGLALGGAIGAHVNLVMLWRGMSGTLARLDLAQPARTAGWTAVVSLAALGAALAVQYGVTAGRQLLSFLVIATYCIVFMFAARAAKIPEATRMVSAVMRRFGK
jgi:putative peptidoglycan lipid II flippase